MFLSPYQLFPRDCSKECVFWYSDAPTCENAMCLAFSTFLLAPNTKCPECNKLTSMLQVTDIVSAVDGISMYPALKPYDICLFRPLEQGERVEDYEIVVLVPPNLDVPVIKRVFTSIVDKSGEVRYYVLGDNRAHSNDSRNYGFVPSSSILGKVFYTVRPHKRMHPEED